jgi:RES domain-containing protein
VRVATVIAWRVTPLPPGQRMDRRADRTARWHRGAAPVVYASSTPELAVLEALAHLEAPMLPHALLRLVLRDVHVRQVRGLPRDWKTRKPLTRDIGDTWLAHGRAQVLSVPSALCAEARNLLVASGRLAAAQMRCQRVRGFRFDPRLLQGLKHA